MNFNKNEAWSFGKTERKFEVNSLTPSPNRYEIKNYFKKTSPSWHMGAKFKNKEPEIPPENAFNYNIKSKIGEGPKYSMRGKSETKNKFDENNPAPILYDGIKKISLYASPKWSMRGKYEVKQVSNSPGPVLLPDIINKKLNHVFEKEERFKNKNDLDERNYSPNTKQVLKSSPKYSLRPKINIIDKSINPLNCDYNPKTQENWKNTM